MKFKKDWILYIILTIIVFVLQFILANKHLQYGFDIDDWYVLAWYKQVVSDPILDIFKAWKAIGPHNFTHAYYIGLLYEVFKFDFQAYHIFNTILKILAVLSIYPFVYILFKNKLLAFFTTIIFAFHFSPFGALTNVLAGSDALMIASINLFMVVYVWASQRHLLSSPKILTLLLISLLSSAIFDVTRAYPFILLLPLIELINILVNQQSTSLKAILFRLLFFSFPFLVLIAYSPDTALEEVGIKKLVSLIQTGNFQLIVSLFASFGSTFVHQDLIDKLILQGILGPKMFYQDLGTFLYFLVFRFLIIVFPALFMIGYIVFTIPKRFIITSLSLNILLVTLASWAGNHWLHLEPKFQAAVDPRTYFIPGLIGLFIISTATSFFTEWLRERSNYLILALGIAPFFSLLYTLLTWILVNENAIFMGVHAYLNVAAIGSSIYLTILIYLAYRRLIFSKSGLISKLSASFIIIYFIVFIVGSARQVDDYYTSSLKKGLDAKEQQKIQNSFWKEVGFKKPIDKSATLIFLDASGDYPNGSFYANSLMWNIPGMLAVRRDEPFDPDGFCKTVVVREHIKDMRIESIYGKDVIVQTTCGKEFFYSLDNFYAFKMSNRDIVPIKYEVIKELRTQ